MAAKGKSDDLKELEDKVLVFVKDDGLVVKFQAFANNSAPKEKKDKCPLNSKASGKLAGDCWEAAHKNIKNTVDASVFSKWPKTGMEVNADNCASYILRTAQELVKNKKKLTKLEKSHYEEVEKMAKSLSGLVLKGPKIKEVKQSATGNVGGLTDASHYTGAHKERFDADGKGKGASGHADIADNSGYVGNYKGDGTFDKKK